MGKAKTEAWESSKYINTREDMAAYLEAALDDGDPQIIAGVLGDIARSKGMTELARETGLGRESLYKSLSSGGNPEFATILKVMKALGLKLRAIPDNGDEAA